MLRVLFHNLSMRIGALALCFADVIAVTSASMNSSVILDQYCHAICGPELFGPLYKGGQRPRNFPIGSRRIFQRFACLDG
jgi:hypothetical protein